MSAGFGLENLGDYVLLAVGGKNTKFKGSLTN